MTEYERAFSLMDRLDERSAERTIETAYGPVIAHERLHRVHDLNFLRAERPAGATAAELASEAEQMQPHRVQPLRVTLRDEQIAAELEPGFSELGWEPQHFVLMAHRREPDRA